MSQLQYFLLQIESTGSEVAVSDTPPDCEWEMSGMFQLLLSSETPDVFWSFQTSSEIFRCAHDIFEIPTLPG